MTGGEKPGAGRWKKPKPGEWTLEKLESLNIFRAHGTERRWDDMHCEQIAVEALEFPIDKVPKRMRLELLWQARWRHRKGVPFPPRLREWTDRFFFDSDEQIYVPSGPPEKPRSDAFCVAVLEVLCGWSEDKAIEYVAKKSGRSTITVKKNIERLEESDPDFVNGLRPWLRDF